MGIGAHQADIVFCIDASGSMLPCIQGVKDNIARFIDSLDQGGVPGQQAGTDWTLGLVTFTNVEFRVLEPTKDLERFRRALQETEAGADELPLPALDWALDFPWRGALVHRVIVFMTDEVFTGGDELKLQLSRFQGQTPDDTDYLLGKFLALRPILLLVAPACTEYNTLAQLPKSHFLKLDGPDFQTVDFSHVMTSIGKTVSMTMGGYVPGQLAPKLPELPRDIYGMAERIQITRL